MAGHFAVQVVAFVADQFVFVDPQPEQVAAAVGQPTDAMPVWASGSGALVEAVVFVLPHRHDRAFEGQVVLVSHHVCSQMPMGSKGKNILNMSTSPARRQTH